MIYADIDERGFAKAFYPSALYGMRLDENGLSNPQLPEGVIEIDFATWQEWLSAGNHVYYDRELKQLVTVAVTALTFEEKKALASQMLADRRYSKETGGMTWRGLHVRTDRESQGQLLAAFVAASSNLRTDGSIWKFIDGPQPLSNADLIDLAMTVFGFVQNCFEEEAITLRRITAATDLTSIESILAELQA